jgi:hypothetical protein
MLAWALALISLLGRMPAQEPIATQGVLRAKDDTDLYEVYVGHPCTLDLRVITGAASYPFGTAHSDPLFTDSFLPIVSIYAPDGSLVHTQVSTAPCLLWLDLTCPLWGESFYVEISAYPGSSYGPYGLQVSVSH